MQAAQAMKEAAAANSPFTDEELDLAVLSLQSLIPDDQSDIDWAALRQLYAASAHLSHKDWQQTQKSAAALRGILGTPDSPVFRSMFARVLEDGKWDAAVAAAASRPAGALPWVVLITGLNGIRKTTSVHQPWFQQLLRQALGAQFEGDSEALPAGSNTFFRQLDFMIATVALEQFRRLFGIGEGSCEGGPDVSADDGAIKEYATFKEAIFARYRTMSEILGVLLVQECQAKQLNLMVETSGRDVGMYQYIDMLFPGDTSGYRKLVINFTINDISHAERSVDTRMQAEREVGAAALKSARLEGGSKAGVAIMRANAGGPYGSSVLAGVQADSQRVWQSILQAGEGDVGYTWCKASIAIDASKTSPWRARAAESTRADNASFQLVILEADGDAADGWEFGPKP